VKSQTIAMDEIARVH